MANPVFFDKSKIHDSKITITQGGVEKGSFTLNQSSDKTIEVDAGGGSDGGCILEVFQHGGVTGQAVTWNNKDGKQCRLYRDPYTDDKVTLQVYDASEYKGIVSSVCVPVPVVGNLSINWEGYSSDCELLLDGCYTDSRPTVIDSSLYKHILIHFSSCLEWHTPVSMADGSTKPVGEIREGDEVLSFDPFTMLFTKDFVTMADGALHKTHDVRDVWMFDDGTTLETVHPHQFYNCSTGRMEYIADFKPGDRVRIADGSTPALVSHETIRERTEHATIFTEKFNNYFANGVLTGNRDSVMWGWRWRHQHGA